MNASPSHEIETQPPRGRLRARDAAVATLTVVVIVALALMARRLAPLVLLVFGGALVAIFLRALADATARWTGLSYHWSLGLVVTALVSLSVAGLFYGGQVIAEQMADLVEQVPKSLEKLRNDVSQTSWGKRLVEAVPSSAEEIPLKQREAAAYATGALSSFSGMLAALLVVVILAIYLAADPATHVEGAVRLIPVARRERVREVLGEIHETLRGWLVGQIAAMAIVGVLTTVGLGLLGVPLAIALGVIAAVLTFVPNFGPIIAAVPAVLLAFVQSPMTAAYVVALYLAIQTVESYAITPLIQQRTASLPATLAIAAQIGMGILFGVGGVVLATPMAAAAQVAITRLYVEDALEKKR
jgi:predicted PurR-regulated permease PerM